MIVVSIIMVAVACACYIMNIPFRTVRNFYWTFWTLTWILKGILGFNCPQLRYVIISIHDINYFSCRWISAKKELSQTIIRFWCNYGPSHLGRSHLIRHSSKTPFKVPFKNRFFCLTYPYPRSGALTIRIRVTTL